ncbi:LytR/AlgR family response regulator transcription factor [Flectobacillus roseus]|uniref:LytTR family DNA-binding domain-containing protein n=1 Tax=Flectobacillus roseus TaxID=502259 RepID=A0ABT6YGU4_9BACT|nr:LytTR family DNA-binding domain-containing protein [Flectobacillus roseus]MDI9862662.1 LytTR family DNA-binding domain-containing protein [Flectobacillus roseus]
MQNKNRVNYPVKTLIVTADNLVAKHILSLLDEESHTCVGIANDLITIYYYLDLNQIDLIITDVKTSENPLFEIFTKEALLEIPILFIVEVVDNAINELISKHPKSLLLSTPLHEFSFKSSINLLISAYPPKLTQYIEVFNRNHQTIKIRFEEILFIEAQGNYTFINTTYHKVFVRKKTLKKFKQELGSMFIQINKSQIINTSYIKRVELGKGSLVLSGKEIKIGRAFKYELKQFLQQI